MRDHAGRTPLLLHHDSDHTGEPTTQETSVPPSQQNMNPSAPSSGDPSAPGSTNNRFPPLRGGDDGRAFECCVHVSGWSCCCVCICGGLGNFLWWRLFDGGPHDPLRFGQWSSCAEKNCGDLMKIDCLHGGWWEFVQDDFWGDGGCDKPPKQVGGFWNGEENNRDACVEGLEQCLLEHCPGLAAPTESCEKGDGGTGRDVVNCWRA